MGSDEASGIVTTTSAHDVAETVRRLTGLIEGHGITLFTVVDHSGGAADVGLEMPETKVVIFGNPRAGTPVMLAAPLSAFDLPLRVLVADDAAGTCRVSYLSTAAFASRYGLDEDIVKPLNAVAGLVAAATAATAA